MVKDTLPGISTNAIWNLFLKRFEVPGVWKFHSTPQGKALTDKLLGIEASPQTRKECVRNTEVTPL
jgi:hypothetical protein